jgi:hypothetical protein
MPSLLSYRDQAFWVSNGTKDLLYEVAVAVAQRESPVVYQRLTEDGRLLGCFGVSGLGFPLEAFAEAFGGPQAWREAMTRHAGVVAALCPTPACTRLLAKLFAWIWFLLSGGRCQEAADEYPVFDSMPDIPGTMAVASSNRPVQNRRDAGTAEPGPWTKILFGIGLGAILGTPIGVANILFGLANNWLTIPAWIIAGALLGSAHPTAEVVLRVFLRPSDR